LPVRFRLLSVRTINRLPHGTPLLAGDYETPRSRRRSLGTPDDRRWKEVLLGVFAHSRCPAGRHCPSLPQTEERDSSNHKRKKAIVAYSRADGTAGAEDIEWAAQGTSARSAGIKPHRRPGWSLSLTRTLLLRSPLTLATIRKRHRQIMRRQDTWDALPAMPAICRSSSERTACDRSKPISRGARLHSCDYSPRFMKSCAEIRPA